MYFQTKLTEIELEDIIYFQRYQDIQESGLSVYDHLSWDNSKVLRQLSLGSYGRPDLVGINFQGDSETLKEVCITIYELKSGEVSFEALCQIMKYQYALRKLFSENQKCKGIDIHISTCLIGHTVNNSVDFMAASAELEVWLYTYKSTRNGVLFDRVVNHNYKPDDYEKVWYGEGRKLDMIKLFRGEQDVVYDKVKHESWIKG